MPDVLSAALFPESLSDAERAEVRHLLAEDAAARRLYRAAQALEARLADDLDGAVPDRRLLVLDALAESPHAGVLDVEERALLAREAERLRAAQLRHPALEDVTRQIARECEAFEACWSARPAPARADRAPRRREGSRWAWRASVALAFVAFAAVAMLLVQRDAAYTTVEVAAGEVRHVTLADGSRVKLFGGSTLAYSDPAANAVFNRRVRLSGDAYFDVTPGAQRFVVETAEAEVMVVGTQFGVRADDAATEVTLVAGQVLLAPAGAPTRGVALAPGQQSRLARGASVPTPPEAVEAREALAWAGMFFFADTPLPDVAAQLSNGLNLRVEVAPALSREALTGTFDRAQGAEEIIRTVAAALGAEAVRTEGGWRIE